MKVASPVKSLYPGIAGGPIVWGISEPVQPVAQHETPVDRGREQVRLEKAFLAAKEELQALYEKQREILGDKEAAIFLAHAEFLEDPVLVERCRGVIAGGFPAEAAVGTAVREICQVFENLKDPLMRERGADIQAVGDLLNRKLSSKAAGSVYPAHLFILMAEQLFPAMLLAIPRGLLLGIVTEKGSATAHVGVLAKSLGVPAFLGAGEGFLQPYRHCRSAILDGDNGWIFFDPEPSELAEYRQQQDRSRQARDRRHLLSTLPGGTRDGRRVEILANISGLDDAKTAMINGAEGIGLFRTEFLFAGRSVLPPEAELEDTYRQVLQVASGQRVIIRLLDAGGDKPVAGVSKTGEANPFLGCRGARLLLQNEKLLRMQLRAVLRAASFGQVAILFPMVSVVEEIRLLKQHVETVRKELDIARVPVGIMIEVPSAVLSADLLAGEVDFFSIGTNDLTQYLFAVDRTNEAISRLYQPYHPAVLRMLQLVVKSSARFGVEVSVCGEMAGTETGSLLCVGLGIRKLSMNAHAIPEVKELLSRITTRQAEDLASKALACVSSEEVEQLLNQEIQSLKI